MDRWERARRECRQLEAECDARLTVYAASGTAVAGKTSTLGSGSTGSAASTAIQMPDSTSASTADDLERLLGSLSSAVDELAAAMDRLYPQGGASPSMSHALQRHREALYELSREFRRVKANQSAAREHAELLGSVRQDISEYKSAQQQQRSMHDQLLGERDRIDGVHVATDGVLDAAYQARSSLLAQRTSLGYTNKRVTGLQYRFPALNKLIGSIQFRRRRDALLMGLVIGLCCVALVYNVLSR